MRGERGQATVEWLGAILLVTLALAALARFAPSTNRADLGATLARSITCAARDGCGSEEQRPPRRTRVRSAPAPTYATPAPAPAVTAPPLVPHRARPPVRVPPTMLEWARREAGRLLSQRARSGAARAWKHAWFACLVYERARWALLHPESRLPGYTFPPDEALRVVNDCISPLDLFRDWPLLRQ